MIPEYGSLTFDSDGNLSDDTLECIEHAQVESDEECRQLLDLVCRLWHWSDYAQHLGDGKYHFYTGGWSDNEALLGALKRNLRVWIRSKYIHDGARCIYAVGDKAKAEMKALVDDLFEIWGRDQQ